jgi:hypothetical protein
MPRKTVDTQRAPIAPAEPVEIDEMPDAIDLPEEFQGMSLKQIQVAIARADLQAKLLDLDRIKDENQRRLAIKKANEDFNRQIQEEIESQTRILKYAQSVCRHRMGGKYQNVWAGDGKPCIAKTQMLDGYTWLLQCTRCRLKVFTPHPSLSQTDPKRYAEEMAAYQKLWELAGDSGLDEIRGPTFTFVKNGVPFIPQRT